AAQLPTPTMATRTEPMTGCSLLGGSLCGGVDRSVRVRAALGGDELVEPPHLPLHGFQTVPLQFEGVVVHPFRGAPSGARTEGVRALLQAPTAPFEDAQPNGRVGAAEEREPDAEGVVVPFLGPAGAHQLREVVLAVRG